MNEVWLLWFEQERPEEQDTELLIGVYRTEKNAKAAITRVIDQPGFREYPEGLRAYRHTLDQDGWREVFVRV